MGNSTQIMVFERDKKYFLLLPCETNPFDRVKQSRSDDPNHVRRHLKGFYALTDEENHPLMEDSVQQLSIVHYHKNTASARQKRCQINYLST